jgi:hypothetical protein
METVHLLKRNAWSTLMLMTMLVIFPWIVTSVIANLQLAQMAGWQSREPATEPVAETNTPYQVSAVQYAGSSSSWYELAAVSALAALASILIWRIQRRRTKRQDWWYGNEPPKVARAALMIAVGLIVFIFYGLVELARNLPNFIYLSYEPVHPDISRFLIPLAVSLILACSTSGLLMFFRTHESSQVYLDPTKMSEEAHQVASVLDRTIYALKTGSDYRRAVIDCYRSLCAILESSGVSNDSTLTARELEALAVSRLGGSTKYLHEATFLFEKARYSADFVSEDEAKRSIECLEKLRDWVEQRAKSNERLVAGSP